MSKQTAVEWLINELIRKSEYEHLPDHYFFMSEKDVTKIIEQAKAMEIEQMYNAWVVGMVIDSEIETFEKYYNETYKGGEQ